MRRMFVILGLAALGGLPIAAQAQPRPSPRTGPAEEVLSTREALQRLRSNNPDDVRDAVDRLTVIGTPEVIPPLVERIRSGLPDGMLEYFVEKLGYIQRPECIDPLAELLRHRRAAVRQAALRSLRQIRDPRVRPLLESGLRDSDATVRGIAARMLGEINSRDSVGILVRAFDRNVAESVEPIGRMGDLAANDHVFAELNRRPLVVLWPAYNAFLSRRDIPERERQNRLERLCSGAATPQLRTFLQAWDAAQPPGERGPLRRRVRLCIQQIQVAPAGGAAAPAGGAAPAPAPAPQAAAGGAR